MISGSTFMWVKQKASLWHIRMYTHARMRELQANSFIDHDIELESIKWNSVYVISAPWK